MEEAVAQRMEFLKSAGLAPKSQPTDLMPPPPVGGGPSMEVAHVLFMDVVGYSVLRINQQASAQLEMQNLVNASSEVQTAKSERKFICRPAGDGMALIFFRDIASPVRTALQIHEEMQKNARAIQARLGAPLKMRMGIHSGVVLMVEDLNSQSDAAGEGINIAQRVMDCGDADHILVSSKVAESLLTVDPWQHYLRDIGDCRVKHGVVVHLYLLHGRLSGGYYGNVAIPKKVAEEQEAMEREASRFRGSYFDTHPEMRGRLAALGIAIGLIGGCMYSWAKVPAFKSAVQTTFAHFAGKPEAKPPTKSGPAHGEGGHAPHSESAHGGSHPHANSAPDSGDAPTRVAVPDLLGKPLDDAESAVENQDLHLAKNPPTGYNTQYGEGLIYEQTPSAGEYVAPGARITVHISKGDPPDATVPGAEPSASGGQ